MAKMNLNIQKFNGEGTDLDFVSADTDAFISALLSGVEEVKEGINEITNGVNTLVKEWGDGNAVSIGNNFNDVYKQLIEAICHYVNSIGEFTSTAGEAFTSHYNLSGISGFNADDLLDNVDEFNNVNENNNEGPIDSEVGTRFDNVFNNGADAVHNGLQTIINGVNASEEIFPEDILNEARNTIESENNNCEQKLEATRENYMSYLQPYLEEACSLVAQGQSAASGAGVN